MTQNKHRITANFVNGSRFEQYDGRRHLVLPIIMMVEGVHAGSGGPILYTAEELSRFAEAWNGRPVPVLHPEVNGQGVSCNHPEIMEEWNVGQLFNTYWDGSKLRSEAWIDVERCQQRYPDVYTQLIAGEPMDVSTGLFSDDERVQGNWQGEDYIAIAHNIRPDHLALLPGAQGACSWADGCGVRANKKEDAMPNGTGKERPPVQVHVSGGRGNKMLQRLAEIFTNEMSLDDKVEALWSYADSLDVPERLVNFVDAVYDNYFILREVNQNNGQRSETLYQINYTFDENQNLSVENERQEVRKDVSYVATNEGVVSEEVEEAAKATEAIVDNIETVDTEQEEKSMKVNETIKGLVDGLIANEATKFNEEDREFLEGLTECQLNKMIPVENQDVAPDAEPAEEPAADADPDAEPTGNSGKIEVTPELLQEMVANGIKANEEASKKTVLLNRLEAAGQKPESFDGMTVDQLELVANALAPAPSYAGMGFPVSQAPTDNANAAPEMEAVVLANETTTEQ